MIEVNELQKRRVMKKLEKHLDSLVGRTVVLLGPGVQAEHRRHARGVEPGPVGTAPGRGRDGPRLRPGGRARARELLARRRVRRARWRRRSTGADAAILVTEWPEFAELDWAALAPTMATPLLVDGRNFLDPKTLRAAGFTYEGIGRPPS